MFLKQRSRRKNASICRKKINYIMNAPLLGPQITVLHFTFADMNPFSIAVQIFLGLDDLEVKAIIEGPAPLIVTPIAPALRAFFFT